MQYKHKIAALRQAGPLLLQHGVVPADFLRKLELPITLLLDPDGWVDRRISFRLANAAASVTADRYFCLHAAEHNKFEQMGEWGQSILGSTTLRRAIENSIRTIGHIHTGTWIQLTVVGGNAHLAAGFAGELGENPIQRVESNMLMLRKLLDLTGETVPAELQLPHSTPRGSDELERFFGPRIVLNADRAELVFDSDALGLPLREHQIVDIAKAYSLPPTAPRDTGGAVMRVLREMIATERPTAAAVAEALQMNLRTMQRHLSAWGLTFEDLLDGFRRRQAIDDLHCRQYTITDIAFRLGYSDSAHFTRAFRRWTGHSPRQAILRSAS